MNTLGKFMIEKRNLNNLSLTEASSLSGISQTHSKRYRMRQDYPLLLNLFLKDSG